MTDFEQWSWALLKHYQKILLLTDHEISFEYSEEVDDENLFEYIRDYPYKTSDIIYGQLALKAWNAGDKKQLEDGLIHELCHSITDPLFSAACDRYISEETIKNEHERLTDHIAHMVARLTQ